RCSSLSPYAALFRSSHDSCTPNGLSEDSIADQISLYYFSDVPRLMKILNSRTHQVGDTAAADEATAKRKDLNLRENALILAQSDVNNLQRKLEALREQMRQSEKHEAFL